MIPSRKLLSVERRFYSMKPICLIRGAACLLLLLGSTSLPVDARPLLPGEAVQEKDAAPYAGFAWRVDAVNEDARTLPKNFRTSDDPFREANVKKFPAADPAFIPSRKGLATLRISGSAAFSKSSLAAIKDVLRKHRAGPIYIRRSEAGIPRVPQWLWCKLVWPPRLGKPRQEPPRRPAGRNPTSEKNYRDHTVPGKVQPKKAP